MSAAMATPAPASSSALGLFLLAYPVRGGYLQFHRSITKDFSQASSLMGMPPVAHLCLIKKIDHVSSYLVTSLSYFRGQGQLIPQFPPLLPTSPPLSCTTASIRV